MSERERRRSPWIDWSVFALVLLPGLASALVASTDGFALEGRGPPVLIYGSVVPGVIGALAWNFGTPKVRRTRWPVRVVQCVMIGSCLTVAAFVLGWGCCYATTSVMR